MKFRGRVLEALQGVYQFLGGVVSTDDIPLDNLQLVHDVSRAAEAASGYGFTIAPGYWMLRASNVHPVGGETIVTAMTPYNLLTSTVALVPPSPGVGLWLLRRPSIFSSTVNILTSARVSLANPPLPGCTITGYEPLIYSAADRLFPNSAGAADTIDMAMVNAEHADSPIYPLFLPFGAILSCQSVAVALTPGTIEFIFPAWVGPRGVRPPGVA